MYYTTTMRQPCAVSPLPPLHSNDVLVFLYRYTAITSSVVTPVPATALHGNDVDSTSLPCLIVTKHRHQLCFHLYWATTSVVSHLYTINDVSRVPPLHSNDVSRVPPFTQQRRQSCPIFTQQRRQSCPHLYTTTRSSLAPAGGAAGQAVGSGWVHTAHYPLGHGYKPDL